MYFLVNQKDLGERAGVRRVRLNTRQLLHRCWACRNGGRDSDIRRFIGRDIRSSGSSRYGVNDSGGDGGDGGGGSGDSGCVRG